VRAMIRRNREKDREYFKILAEMQSESKIALYKLNKLLIF
jgi:hypothetical protein